MIQPFLNARANPEVANILSTPGRPTDIDVVRLRGKHVLISIYPKRKTCTACGYKADKNGKQSRKNTSVKSVICMSVKIVLKNLIPVVRYNICLMLKKKNN